MSWKMPLDGDVRSPVKVQLGAAGFVPALSKLHPAAPGAVARAGLADAVRSARGDVITVTAPPGYGKSTFMAELGAADRRPGVWISLDRGDNEPAVLLSDLALALEAVEPVPAAVVAALWTHTPTIDSHATQAVGSMLATRRDPFLLVLDDVHVLHDRDALDVLHLVVGHIPPGSTIVLGSRAAVPLPLGRMRTRRRLIEVGAHDLAFGVDEALALFDHLAIGLPPDDVAALTARAEGWPVALHLAGLAHARRGGSSPSVVDDFAGDHRFLVEYLGEELLAGLDESLSTFLLEAACLERMSGPLCDAVLGRARSALLLEEACRRNLLVIPLDDRREWYRLHHLLAEFLQDELARRAPARRAAIHAAASTWFDDHGEADSAVAHAVRSGDVDHAEATVLRWHATVASAGRRHPTTDRWLAMFPAAEIERRPMLMVAAAWGSFAAGRSFATAQWLDRASAAVADPHPPHARGYATPAVALAAARSVMAPLTPTEMMAEAVYVAERVGFGEGHPVSCLARGAAAFMLGQEAEALRWLTEGAATTLARPLVVANCLAHQAVIEAERSRWADATEHARRARVLLGEATEYASAALVLAASAMVETHAGRTATTETDREACRRHLGGLTGIAPWLNLQARLALARSAIMRGERVEAAALLDELVALVDAVPSAVRVATQVTTLARELATRDRTSTRDRMSDFGPSSLTTAELRVLRLLPTHLSIGEIAERLYVSRNTVKSQTISIYRKLGTTSRAGAVDLAAAARLLPPSVDPLPVPDGVGDRRPAAPAGGRGVRAVTGHGPSAGA